MKVEDKLGSLVEDTKRVWTPWKTAQAAVSHRAHTLLFSLKTRKEDRLKQRS